MPGFDIPYTYKSSPFCRSKVTLRLDQIADKVQQVSNKCSDPQELHRQLSFIRGDIELVQLGIKEAVFTNGWDE
jgi:hypothetical protein